MTTPLEPVPNVHSAAALRRRVAVAAAVSVAWCLVLLLIVDPWFTISRDIDVLYSSEAGGFSPFLSIIGLVTATGVLAWLVTGVLIATLAKRLDSGQRRLLGRACSVGVFGPIVMASALLYMPVSLGLYTRAESLGIAPATGSTSAAAVATLIAGVAAFVVAAVLGGKASEPSAVRTQATDNTTPAAA